MASSIVLTKPSSLVHTFRCSALSLSSLVDQLERFSEALKKGNLIPLYRTIFSDHLTPALAYRCLVKVKEDDRDAPSFLFESVEPGLRASSIVIPFFLFILEIVEDPMIFPRRLMEGWTPQLVDELPEAFCGRYSSVEDAFNDGMNRLEASVSRVHDEVTG